MRLKKTLSRVAGQPAGKLRVITAPMQGKEEDLTNSSRKKKRCVSYSAMSYSFSIRDYKFPGIWKKF